MASAREWMLILAGDRAPVDPRPYRVTQKVSPRVFLVEADAIEELRALEGMRAVLGPGENADDELRRELTPTELLFIDAFAQRARAKVRPGEGLSWDSEGFLPPDPPEKV
jgi:hypothetical protein